MPLECILKYSEMLVKEYLNFLLKYNSHKTVYRYQQTCLTSLVIVIYLKTYFTCFTEITLASKINYKKRILFHHLLSTEYNGKLQIKFLIYRLYIISFI